MAIAGTTGPRGNPLSRRRTRCLVLFEDQEIELSAHHIERVTIHLWGSAEVWDVAIDRLS
jgi:hypothetical protein